MAVDDAEAASGACESVDFGGRVVVPGFNDAHHHLALRGRRLQTLDVSFSAAPSREKLLDIVSDAAAQVPDDGWVRGGGFDQNRIGGFPTREELDRAAGGRKVLLSHVSEHIAVVSTSALEYALFESGDTVPDLARVPHIPGGEIVLGQGGYATGLLLENAKKWFDATLKPHSVAEMRSFLSSASQDALSAGITSITDPGVGGIDGIGMGRGDVHAYMVASEQGDLGVRVNAFPYITTTHPIESLEPNVDGWGLDLGMRTGFGHEMLRLGAVKVLTDGALVGRTAALGCAYEGHDHDGVLTFDPEWLREVFKKLHRSGWQIAAHAIGDRAVDNAVDLLEEAMRSLPRKDPRHRIEHCGMVSNQVIERIYDLGIIPVPQGRFVYELGDGFIEVLGMQRCQELIYRLKSHLDAGTVLPGSSDTPVVDSRPLLGMQSMINRKTLSGQVIGPQEGISLDQAVRAYTFGSAYASHEEHKKGTLAHGMLADMAVLAIDPWSVDVEDLDEVQVDMTILGGEIVFNR